MRKLVLQMGMSVDGYVAGGPEGSGDPAEHEHADVTAWKVGQLRKTGLHIMGRVTYEQMAAYWPSATDVYAAFMNDIPKVVFSKTLSKADWARTRIAGGELAEEIGRLKQEPEGDIMVHGGASFVQALSRLRLIDEYHLVIGPVALGSGLPMFRDMDTPLSLELAEANTFPDGTIITVYRRP
ncbi:MAG: dihydrofolate reductase family protein [Candidatus Dormibacteria bacterium]